MRQVTRSEIYWRENSKLETNVRIETWMDMGVGKKELEEEDVSRFPSLSMHVRGNSVVVDCVVSEIAI